MINSTEFIKRALIGSLPDSIRNKIFTKHISDDIVSEYENYPIPEVRLTGKDWPDNAETMIGYERLTNLEKCLFECIENKIDGDFIETGVWKGGACIFAKYIINLNNSNKKVFVADSFEGLPAPNNELYPQDKTSNHHLIDVLKVSLEDVMYNFKKYDLLDDGVIFLKGWFKDTLINIKQEQKFCIIRLDGDMYESTMDALENLYPKLTKGGYIIIDDFCLNPCVEATNDFRKKYGITTPILHADFTGVYWKKE